MLGARLGPVIAARALQAKTSTVTLAQISQLDHENWRKQKGQGQWWENPIKEGRFKDSYALCTPNSLAIRGKAGLITNT